MNAKSMLGQFGTQPRELLNDCYWGLNEELDGQVDRHYFRGVSERVEAIESKQRDPNIDNLLNALQINRSRWNNKISRHYLNDRSQAHTSFDSYLLRSPTTKQSSSLQTKQSVSPQPLLK